MTETDETLFEPPPLDTEVEIELERETAQREATYGAQARLYTAVTAIIEGDDVARSQDAIECAVCGVIIRPRDELNAAYTLRQVSSAASDDLGVPAGIDLLLAACSAHAGNAHATCSGRANSLNENSARTTPPPGSPRVLYTAGLARWLAS